MSIVCLGRRGQRSRGSYLGRGSPNPIWLDRLSSYPMPGKRPLAGSTFSVSLPWSALRSVAAHLTIMLPFYTGHFSVSCLASKRPEPVEGWSRAGLGLRGREIHPSIGIAAPHYYTNASRAAEQRSGVGDRSSILTGSRAAPSAPGVKRRGVAGQRFVRSCRQVSQL